MFLSWLCNAHPLLKEMTCVAHFSLFCEYQPTSVLIYIHIWLIRIDQSVKILNFFQTQLVSDTAVFAYTITVDFSMQFSQPGY